MRTGVILAALEDIVGREWFKISYFVKLIDDVMAFLLMRQINDNEFEVYCNVERGNDLIVNGKKNRGCEGIKGFELHQMAEWDSYVDYLQSNGWVNRDKYTGDFMKWYIRETPEERYSRLKTKTEPIKRAYSKISTDAHSLLTRLQFMVDVLTEFPEGLDYTMKEVEDAVEAFNLGILGKNYNMKRNSLFATFTIEAIDESKIIFNTIKSLDITENIEVLIGKLLDLLHRLCFILPDGSGEKSEKKIFKAVKNSKSSEDISKSIEDISKYYYRRRDYGTYVDAHYSKPYGDLPPFDPDILPDIIEEDLEKYSKASFVSGGDHIIIEDADEELKAEILSIMGNEARRYINGYKVRNLTTEAAYNSDIKSCKGVHKKEMILWHGSINKNWFNIIENGMLISKAADGMFGVGLYFADDADKSRGYSSAQGSRWANGTSSSGFIALFKVRIGKKLSLKESNHDAKELMLESGCDSVKGCKGKNLRKNEYVIYDEHQCTIYALVEIN